MNLCKAYFLIFTKLLTTLIILTDTQTVYSSRTSRSSIENRALLAFEHGVRVREFGSCRNPKPVIVYVPTKNPSKVYLPRGTVLHRCSDQTGCCPHPSQSCQSIESETVHLYFFTVTLVIETHKPSRKTRHHQNVEKISFQNDTKCACIDYASNDQLNEI